MSWRCALALLSIVLSACAGLGGEPEILATVAPTAPPSLNWAPDISNGARIFAQRCTECHGSDGAGRGALVIAGSVAPPLDMTDRGLVAAKSPLEWFDIISEGKIENLMPPWELALSERERWDVALYSYTLAYRDAALSLGERLWRESCGGCALPAAIPPVFSDVDYGRQVSKELFASALNEEERLAVAAFLRMSSLEAGAATAPPLAQIRGRVEHGAGGDLPAGVTVQLRADGGAAGAALAETVTAVDGSFVFPDMPPPRDRGYLLSAAYAGRLFQRRLPAEALATAPPVVITVYDSGSDPSVVTVARIDLWAEAVTLEDWGRGLYIAQSISYHNASDRLYTSGRSFDDGREAVLLAQFPEGARILSGDGGGRYVLIDGLEDLPNSVIDTLPVAPGTAHQIALEYFLPYDKGIVFVQGFNNALDGEVSLTLGAGLRAEADWLRREAAPGAANIYRGELRHAAAPELRFSLYGDPFSSGNIQSAVLTSDAFPALLLGGGGLALLLAAGMALWRRKRRDAEGTDALLRELARLDAEHESGRLNHDLWHQQRRALKAKLAALMAESES